MAAGNTHLLLACSEAVDPRKGDSCAFMHPLVFPVLSRSAGGPAGTQMWQPCHTGAGRQKIRGQRLGRSTLCSAAVQVHVAVGAI